MNGLLDTAVLVDLLRGHPPATSWLATQPRLGISPIAWLEIIEGSQDLKAQARAVGLLHHFERTDLAPEDLEWAIEQLLRFRLSNNVGMMDCLIASSAQRLGIPLYTSNLKHFRPLLGELAQRPY